MNKQAARSRSRCLRLSITVAINLGLLYTQPHRFGHLPDRKTATVIIIYLFPFLFLSFTTLFYWIVSVWEKRIFHFFRIHEIRNTLTKTKYIRKTLLFEGSFLILFFQKISFTLSLFVKDEHHMEVIISSSRYNFQIFKNLSFSTVVKQKKIFTFFLSTPHILVCPHPHN